MYRGVSGFDLGQFIMHCMQKTGGIQVNTRRKGSYVECILTKPYNHVPGAQACTHNGIIDNGSASGLNARFTAQLAQTSQNQSLVRPPQHLADFEGCPSPCFADFGICCVVL